VGREYPFSVEKLCPVLAFYTVKDWQEGCRRCLELLEQGGLGHTLGIHCEDSLVIEAFGLEKPASRIVVNAGTTFGGIGATTALFPSMTLGCGSFGGNITSDNIGPQHLLNTKRVAFGVREMPAAPRPELRPVEERVAEAIAGKGGINRQSISREEVTRIVRKVLAEMENREGGML
jgi:hypothetical protein